MKWWCRWLADWRGIGGDTPDPDQLRRAVERRQTEYEERLRTIEASVDVVQLARAERERQGSP